MVLLRTLQRISNTFVTKSGGRFLPGFVFICLVLLPGQLVAAPAELTDLLSRAAQSGLAQSRGWQSLLHYRSGLFGVRSLIDDPKFFLAENGKSDAEAELTATLAGFFEPVGDKVDTHPRCRFPARYHWLDQQLDIAASLPALSCPEFENTRKEIDPQSADLIFPGSNFNNPASMFGHTLVSINGPYKSKLLAHALNYSAITQETNGIRFAVKGIFGFYRGYYSVLPYYAQLKKYNDLERRDIWEYTLTLSREELAQLFRHLWELNEVYSDYYFFDENCAYQLLFLFDIARPSLRLVDAARPWVIPVDTVRLLEENGVIDDAAYRPSKATRTTWIIDHMAPGEKVLAERLLKGELAADAVGKSDLDAEAEVRVLDLAIETLELQYLKYEVERPEYRKRYLALLQQRSYLSPEIEAVPAMPVPTRPDKGHGSYRLSLQSGEVEEESFVEIRLRPAYHSLLDDDAGYLAGSQIDFLNIVGRYYTEPDKSRLHAVDLVSIVSLAPRHRFYKPISWKLQTGFKRQVFADGVDRMLFNINPGGGFTFGSGHLLTSIMLETDLQFSRYYRDDAVLGFGGSVGLLAGLGPKLKFKLDARQVEFLVGDEEFRSRRASGGVNWQLGTNSSLVFEASREAIHDVYKTELQGGFNLYW